MCFALMFGAERLGGDGRDDRDWSGSLMERQPFRSDQDTLAFTRASRVTLPDWIVVTLPAQ